jgi:3-hydroxybutyryl-CoA dehydrogenase
MVDKNQKILVVGAGTMGNGIAQSFAVAGFKVTLYSRKRETLDHAKELMESSLGTCAKQKLIKKSNISSILANLTFTQSLEEGAGDAELVIESVVENEPVKKDIFAQLSKLCGENAIIASNTSALNIFNFAEIKNPGRLIIAHYFTPAYIIPLVELVPGPNTSQETISRCKDILEKAGKSPIVMKKYGPGFIVNRIQKAIGETCLDMIDQGLAGPAEIDSAIKLTLGIRLPIVGVVQTFDFQGLDMLLATQKNYGKVYPFIEEKVNKGYLGAKTSKGIYDYQGRKETEILEKRDELYIKMLEYLKSINAFDPV